MRPTPIRRRGPRTAPAVPSLSEVFVLGLAAQRIARAVSTDEITSPMRSRLAALAERTAGRRVHRPVRRLADLVECPLCTGWWASLLISMMWPGPARIRRGVSIAGVQATLALLERLISESGRDAIHRADLREAARGDDDPLTADGQDRQSA